ncbi:uncharacterized protein LOC106882045 [Octopus bimaculoides]|nr:uncharacterized protein LOC106882045 [Octopus bimaculoides]|eukprot:XP_014788091.1 PREDICTED: uncharacterized protein LOC106882045 [Octopus bimaculoides]
MTVQKLKKIRDWIQVQEAEVSSKEHGFREHPRYKAGFNDCMNEVVRYLSKKDCGNNEFQSHVMSHLNHCYNTGSLVSAEAATKPGSVSSSDEMETNFGIRTYDHHPNQSQIQTQTRTNATLALSIPQPEEHLSGSKCTKQFPVNYNKQYDCSSSLQQATNLNLNNNANRKLTPDLSPCVVANGEMAATSTPKGLFQPVNIITDSIPKLVNSQHAIQLDTNISEPNCKTYVRVITPNSSVNGQEMMETLPSRTSRSSMTQVTASTNTVNMDEMSQRHAGQIITGIDYYNKNNIIFSNNNGGAPIAFLVATPLPVKAIPLYTSLDKTQETCVGVLSPHATNIKSNTTISAEVPPRCQSLNVADSSVLKPDVTNRGHSYRMSNRGDSENKFVTSSNVWRPWNAVE